MNLFRIGDKVVSLVKVQGMIRQILEARSAGRPQQDVADEMGIDRPFISRLERLGEIRRGKRLALIGFPVENRQELRALAEEEGVEFTLLLSEEERWKYVSGTPGDKLFNQLLETIYEVQAYDVVVFLGSDARGQMMQKVLGTEVVVLEIGESPINRDLYVSPHEVRLVLRMIKEGAE